MTIECPCCGEELPDLPEGATEQQARQALRAVILWYQESPIREIQMADAACGRQFPVKEIEAALLAAPEKPQWVADYERSLHSEGGPSAAGDLSHMETGNAAASEWWKKQ